MKARTVWGWSSSGFEPQTNRPPKPIIFNGKFSNNPTIIGNQGGQVDKCVKISTIQHRQLRIQISAELKQTYFPSRPVESKIGQWSLLNKVQ